MEESSFEDSTSGVKGKLPVIRRGEMMPYSDFMEAMGMSPRTLARWKAAGFKVRQPGTRSAWVLTDDIFKIMELDELPPYQPEYKQKE